MITTIKCSKCGFEDSGKFCSNCGSPLEISEKEMTFTDDPVGSWFDKCPVCKSGKLSIERKKMLFGLIKNENIKCSNCDSIFIQEREKYRLSMVMDSSNSIWRIYGNKALDENEWKSVAFEPPVDEKQREVDIEKWLTQIKDGDVSPMSSESPVILKKSEELILSLPEVSLLEARAVITGRSRGSSIRIAKGLSFRLGAFKAQSHDELKNIDQGDFTLTNKRVVFSGSKRTLNIPLNKIISAEPYSDAIALRREDKEKTQYFTGIDRHIITISLSGRTYKEPFSGQVIQCLMEGLTQQNSKTQQRPKN